VEFTSILNVLCKLETGLLQKLYLPLITISMQFYFVSMINYLRRGEK
jgi:hypothetical protein